MLSSHEAGSDDFWLAAALRAKTAGSPVLLPPERITASWQTFAAADEALLRGAGAAQTELAIAGLPDAGGGGMPAKSEGGHVGNRGVSTCRFRGARYAKKK